VLRRGIKDDGPWYLPADGGMVARTFSTLLRGIMVPINIDEKGDNLEETPCGRGRPSSAGLP
jgi:hypothetical protein